MKKSGWFLTLLFVLLLSTGCNEKRSNLYSGVIEGIEVPIVTEMGGEIEQLLVEEGQEVKKGDTLAILDKRSVEQQVKQAEASLEMAKAILDEARDGARGQEISKAGYLVEQNEAQIEALYSEKAKAEKSLQQKIDLSTELKNQLQGALSTLNFQKNRLQNITNLYDSGAESKDHFDSQTDIVNQAETAVNSLQTQVAAQDKQVQMADDDISAIQAQIRAAQALKQSSGAQLDLLKDGVTANTLKQLENQAKVAEGKLEEVRISLSKTTIKAAVDGTIIRRNISLGEVVKPSYQVMTLLQDGKLELKVYIPVAKLDEVRIGKEVQVTVDAYPNDVFKGKVKTIAKKAEFTPKNVQTPDERTKMVFKVTIDVSDGWGRLQPGMPADAQFIGGTSK